jgi:hypothetical protein
MYFVAKAAHSLKPGSSCLRVGTGSTARKGNQWALDLEHLVLEVATRSLGSNGLSLGCRRGDRGAVARGCSTRQHIAEMDLDAEFDWRRSSGRTLVAITFIAPRRCRPGEDRPDE